MLGFGLAEAVTYLTPVIPTVLSSVIKFLAEEIKTSVHDQLLVGDLLRKLFAKAKATSEGKTPEVHLTKEQLDGCESWPSKKLESLT